MKLDKNATASIDIDCQKGFSDLCPKELPIPDGENIVEALNTQATYASLRIGTKDAHPANAVWIADNEHPAGFDLVGQKNADRYWPAHCIVSTKGFELFDGLPKPEDYDFFVWKGMERNLHPYSAVYHDLEKKVSTGLIEYLKDKKIENVIIGGLCLEFCVKATAPFFI